jgi:hypothetical protein
MDGLVPLCGSSTSNKLVRENGELRLIRRARISERYTSWMDKIDKSDTSIQFVETGESHAIYYCEEIDGIPQFRVVTSDFDPYRYAKTLVVVDSKPYWLTWEDGCDSLQVTTRDLGSDYLWLVTSREVVCGLTHSGNIVRGIMDNTTKYENSSEFVGFSELLSGQPGMFITRNGDTIRISSSKEVYIDVEMPDYVGCAVYDPFRASISAGSCVTVCRITEGPTGTAKYAVKRVELGRPIVQQCGKYVLCDDGSIWNISYSTPTAKLVDYCSTRPQFFGKQTRKQAIG